MAGKLSEMSGYRVIGYVVTVLVVFGILIPAIPTTGVQQSSTLGAAAMVLAASMVVSIPVYFVWAVLFLVLWQLFYSLVVFPIRVMRDVARAEKRRGDYPGQGKD